MAHSLIGPLHDRPVEPFAHGAAAGRARGRRGAVGFRELCELHLAARAGRAGPAARPAAAHSGCRCRCRGLDDDGDVDDDDDADNDDEYVDDDGGGDDNDDDDW